MSNEQNRLIEIIKNSNKPLKQISEELEIPYQTLVNYSQGKRRPRNADTWDKLAVYFGVSTAFLMGTDETAKEELNLNELVTLLRRYTQKVSDDKSMLANENQANRVMLIAISIEQLVLLNNLFESGIYNEKSKSYSIIYIVDIITNIVTLTHTLIEHKTNQAIDSPSMLMEDDVKLNERALVEVGKLTTSINKYINHINTLTPFDLFRPEKAEELFQMEDFEQKIKDTEKELSRKLNELEQLE